MVDSNRSVCFGCGQFLQSFSILICADCLDDECNKFEKLATIPSNDLLIQAKNELEKILGKQDWLVDVSLTGTTGEYYIKVNVNKYDNDIQNLIPDYVNGIEVKIE